VGAGSAAPALRSLGLVPIAPQRTSPTPFKLDGVAVRDSIKRWIDAYNAREDQVLAYLSDQKIMYTNCDYSARRLFEGRERKKCWPGSGSAGP
jgi:hypothetical protein